MIAIRSQWRAFVAGASPAVYRILLHGMLYGLSFSISDMLFNFYLHSLGYNNAIAGEFQSIFRVAGVLLGIPVGMSIDRLSAQRMLYIGILSYGLGWAALLLSHGMTIGSLSALQLMSIIYFFIGAANLTINSAVVPLLSTVIEPHQRASMFGVSAAASTAIGFFGSLLGGSLPGWLAPWLGVAATDERAYRSALFAAVIFGLLAVLPLIGIKRAAHGMSRQGINSNTVIQEKPNVSFSRLLLFASPSVFFGIAGGMFVPFQNLYFRQQFNEPDSVVGICIALGSFAMGVGSIIGGPMAQRWGVRRGAAFSRILAAPLMIVMLITNFYVVSVAYDLNRMLVGLTFPLFSALMMQTVPLRQRGTATSMSSMTWSLGWAGASILSGYMQDAGSFNLVLIVSGLSYVVSGLLIYYLPYTDKLD